MGNGIPPTQPVTTAVSNNPFQPQATATNASGGGGDPWGAQAQGQSSGKEDCRIGERVGREKREGGEGVG